MSRPKRAEPLSPDQRRQAIAKAILPVLVKRGAAATSRELAQAAGVAEGTLFSVFGTKRDMIIAAIERHLDPEPITDGLKAIPSDWPLEDKLNLAAKTITASSKDAIILFGILQTMPSPDKPSNPKPPPFMRAWHKALTESLTALLEQHAAELRIPAESATTAFSSLLMTASRPYGDATPALETKEVVDLFLNGTLKGGATDAV